MFDRGVATVSKGVGFEGIDGTHDAILGLSDSALGLSYVEDKARTNIVLDNIDVSKVNKITCFNNVTMNSDKTDNGVESHCNSFVDEEYKQVKIIHMVENYNRIDVLDLSCLDDDVSTVLDRQCLENIQLDKNEVVVIQNLGVEGCFILFDRRLASVSKGVGYEGTDGTNKVVLGLSNSALGLTFVDD